MKKITFKYHDEYCRDGKWRTQTCTVSSVEECIRIYGLDNCEYEILSVEDV